MTRRFASALALRLSCLAVLLATLLLPGCQSGSPGASSSGSFPSGRLQQILDRGELRVGVSADLPPLNMKNKQGEIIGFEVDLVRALADAMGLELRFVERPFGKLLETVERGDVDLAISGMTITPERNARVAFAGPYFVSGTSVVSKSESLTNVQDIELLDDPRRSYAALAGSTSEAFVKSSLPRATLRLVQDYEHAVQMVIDDEVDALVADYQVCNLAVWRNPDVGLSAMMTPFTVEPLGIALPADAPLLLNLVSNYMNTLENTGLLTRYKSRWLSDGSWLSELP